MITVSAGFAEKLIALIDAYDQLVKAVSRASYPRDAERIEDARDRVIELRRQLKLVYRDGKTDLLADWRPRADHDVELTSRELDVLRGVAEGLTNAQIATQLRISDNTVKSHLKRIMFKLNVSNRAGAAVEASRRGLL